MKPAKKPALHVVAPGLLTTIQDLGRVGSQRFGVSVSGALDPVSLRAANLLVGNAPDAGALEVACLGPTLAVEADEVRIALAGAQAAIEVLPDAAAARGRQAASMQSMRVKRGEVLRVGALTGGTVAYLAVEGGFAVDPVLGSVATDIRGGIGGLNGRALATGDRLLLHLNRCGDRDEVCLDGFHARPRPRIRAIIGPQLDCFPDREVAVFFDAEYTVGPSADRMGMRLTGPALRHAHGFDIVSDGIAAGSIQVPGNGQPIVMLADRQPTGGYPKIATIISADLPTLARLPIGAKVGFDAVTVAEAEAARREFMADLAAIKVVPLRRSGTEVAPRLSECNLISGVVDAAA